MFRRTPTRKLVAIMFTDMVGYSAQMQRNEARALAVLRRHQKLVRAVIGRFGGREIKTVGDAFLVVFESTLHACECAIALQQSVQSLCVSALEDERFQLRIGLHVGDVERPGGDVYGDSVNIASRVQTQSPAGGLALSGLTYEQIRNKVPVVFRPLGEVPLKNIEHPQVVFVLTSEDIAGLPVIGPSSGTRGTGWGHGRRFLATFGWAAGIVAAVLYVAFFERPSLVPAVAVLPFSNISREPDTEQFVAGMHDTLLTQMAHLGGLKVISQASVSDYQEGPRDLSAIADALGTSHVVEGSVQRAGQQLRVIVKLIEADTLQHVWAGTYDRTLADVFAIQSDLARQIASAVRVVLSPGESQRLSQVPTSSPVAYDAYLRATALEREDRFSLRSLSRIQALLEQALQADPDFALALAALSRVHTYHVDAGFDVSAGRLQQARARAEQALARDADLAEAHWALALYFYYGFLDFGRALTELERVLSLQPHHAEAHAYRGFVLRRAGRPLDALQSLQRAYGLDPRNLATAYELAATHAFLHQDIDADTVCRRGLTVAVEVSDFRLQCLSFSIRVAGSLAPLLTAESDDPNDTVWLGYARAFDQGRFIEAAQFLQRLPDDYFSEWAGAPPRSQLLGDVLRESRDEASAQRAYRQAEQDLLRRLKAYDDSAALVTNQAFARALLGQVYANLGRPSEALEQARRARDLLPESRDRFYGPSLSEELAKIHLRLGATDVALDELERLLSMPSHTHINDLRLQRQWEDLWTLPRFQMLLERYRVVR